MVDICVTGSEMIIFCKETATTEIYTNGHTLSLHGALPIWGCVESLAGRRGPGDIALRIHRLPAPRIPAHRVDAQLRAPAKQFVRERGVGIDLGDVSGAPSHDFVRDLASRSLGERAHQLQHAHAPPGSEVHRQAAALTRQE